MQTLLPVVILLALLGQDAAAQARQPVRTRPAREPSKFLRFVPTGEGGRLETSIVTYRSAEGVTVDLIGAVHIADAGYYRALNERFDDYDAVLFELVRPRAAGTPSTTQPGVTTAPAVRRPGGLRWVGAMQRFLRDHLELEHQLESIDYDRANFVHADLDAETFLEMQEARGESMMKLLMQAMMRELGRGPGAAAQQPSLFEIVAALQAPDRARQLKLVLARQFEQMDDLLAGLEGPRGSVILTERNRAAMKVLQDRIALGDDRIAIFYGAGHLSGMEKILTDEMGFTQVGRPRWLTAWDLSSPATQPATAPAGAPAPRPGGVRP